MTIEYNKPFEVTRSQYASIKIKFSGLIAHRYDEKTGKFFIKLWNMKYKSYLLKFLENGKI